MPVTKRRAVAGNNCTSNNPNNNNGNSNNLKETKPNDALGGFSSFKEKYSSLKTKLKTILYENEVIQDDIRKVQRELLDIYSEKEMLLERVIQLGDMDLSDSDSESQTTNGTVGQTAHFNCNNINNDTSNNYNNNNVLGKANILLQADGQTEDIAYQGWQQSSAQQHQQIVQQQQSQVQQLHQSQTQALQSEPVASQAGPAPQAQTSQPQGTQKKANNNNNNNNKLKQDQPARKPAQPRKSQPKKEPLNKDDQPPAAKKPRRPRKTKKQLLAIAQQQQAQQQQQQQEQLAQQQQQQQQLAQSSQSMSDQPQQIIITSTPDGVQTFQHAQMYSNISGDNVQTVNTSGSVNPTANTILTYQEAQQVHHIQQQQQQQQQPMTIVGQVQIPACSGEQLKFVQHLNIMDQPATIATTDSHQIIYQPPNYGLNQANVTQHQQSHQQTVMLATSTNDTKQIQQHPMTIIGQLPIPAGDSKFFIQQQQQQHETISSVLLNQQQQQQVISQTVVNYGLNHVQQQQQSQLQMHLQGGHEAQPSPHHHQQQQDSPHMQPSPHLQPSPHAQSQASPLMHQQASPHVQQQQQQPQPQQQQQGVQRQQQKQQQLQHRQVVHLPNQQHQQQNDAHNIAHSDELEQPALLMPDWETSVPSELFGASSAIKFMAED